MTKEVSEKFDVQTTMVSLSDIDIHVNRTVTNNGLAKVTHKIADLANLGEFKVTDRFMTSIAGLMGLGASVFRYFSSEEVFARVMEMSPRNEQIQVSYDSDRNLLAAVSKNKMILGMEAFNKVIDNTNPMKYVYNKGIVDLLFDVPGRADAMIAGEDYKKQFSLRIPLDGYGDAISHLALLRLICGNGATFTNKIFSSKIGLGSKDGIAVPILNYIENFNAEEHFNTLNDRIVFASKKRASLREFNHLFNSLGLTFAEYGQTDNRIYDGLARLAGNPVYEKYKLSSPHVVDDKEAAALPIECTVYDLYQFGTEIGTHMYNSDLMSRRRKLEPFITELLTNRFDLEHYEDAKTTKLDGRGFFIDHKVEAELAQNVIGLN